MDILIIECTRKRHFGCIQVVEVVSPYFPLVTRMRGAMPNEESVILLMGRTAMDKSSYARQVPRIDLDRTLFPDEKPPTSKGAISEVEE